MGARLETESLGRTDRKSSGENRRASELRLREGDRGRACMVEAPGRQNEQDTGGRGGGGHRGCKGRGAIHEAGKPRGEACGQGKGGCINQGSPKKENK